MAFDFTGKTAIVTGGTQGIGFEIAKGIVEGGGHVVLLARHEEKGKEALEKLGGEGNHFYKLDVSDAAKARETVDKTFEEVPGVNILINCAPASFPRRSSTRSTTPSGGARSTSTSPVRSR